MAAPLLPQQLATAAEWHPPAVLLSDTFINHKSMPANKRVGGSAFHRLPCVLLLLLLLLFLFCFDKLPSLPCTNFVSTSSCLYHFLTTLTVTSSRIRYRVG